MRKFLDYRAGLARRHAGGMDRRDRSDRDAIQPDLDLVLTHVDDRFDTRMREPSAPTRRRCCRCSTSTISRS